MEDWRWRRPIRVVANQPIASNQSIVANETYLDVLMRLPGDLAEPRQPSERLKIVGRVRYAIVVDPHPPRGFPVSDGDGAL